MSEVTDEIHDRSRPFTGAVFDTIVDVYHAALVREGLADERLLGIDIREVDQSDMRRISDFTAGDLSRPPLPVQEHAHQRQGTRWRWRLRRHGRVSMRTI